MDIHRQYIKWIKNNIVDIPYYNLQEFNIKISRIIGKPVNNVFIGRFIINSSSPHKIKIELESKK